MAQARVTYCSVLRIHAWFSQRTPRDQRQDGSRQVQTSRDNGCICVCVGEIDDRIVRLPLLQPIVELGRHLDTSRHDPVADDPVMRRQGY